ncbi:hypothetical protein BRADI_1g21600v3 [Brachypodium distachyon]|uniref:Uncharacterized protein n=1 Tax=Brachypodium distachyon TaxID=15368 RepID=I1GSE9_BRADI|nr:hypothetical protein BRADI_1g21600v3 [Brachypodium distachyon]PNT74772.1 hypothetical protein BRADI_1g21600v3 [Brachypodium distachyon]
MAEPDRRNHRASEATPCSVSQQTQHRLELDEAARNGTGALLRLPFPGHGGQVLLLILMIGRGDLSPAALKPRPTPATAGGRTKEEKQEEEDDDPAAPLPPRSI